STTLVFVYLLGEAIFDKGTALLAASLMALNSMFNMYGFIVQTDSVFVCFMAGSFYFYLKSIKEGKFSCFILSGLLSGIAVFSKQSALLGPIIVSSTEISRVFLDKQGFKKSLGRIILFILLSLLIVAPWFMHNYLRWGMEFVKHLDGDVTLGEVSILRAGDFIFRTFEPVYLPLILLGFFLSFKKNVMYLFLVFWITAVFILICFKNPHNYYTFPLIPVSFLFISYALQWLYSRIRRKDFRLLLGSCVIGLFMLSALFTYKRFLNRKIGCDEVAQLRDYCNSSASRSVYSLSGLYKAERYYIEPQPMELKNIADIEKERKKQDVFVYRRLDYVKTAEFTKTLLKSASSYKIISQRKYSFFLKMSLVPIFEVFKFDKVAS
ncbi:MAG TPA: glycosyltransferase family 39 protein, partial [Candidatus Margulisiibacteriota bacterium]|nr:glycosyltransferase family 39 protein [Candidatus Margulisiibacteriota bacterium]